MLKVLDGVRSWKSRSGSSCPAQGRCWRTGCGCHQDRASDARRPAARLISSGIIPGAQDSTSSIENGSRNKRSVGLDLGTDRGREILYALVKKSDVFLTSFCRRRGGA